MTEFLDERWFPIGSNGDGELLCLDLRSANAAVCWFPLIGMSGDEAILRFESFADLARQVERSA